MMNDTPSVTSTWPCTLPARRRRISRSNRMPISPTPRPEPSTATQKLPPKYVMVAPK